MGEVTFKGTIDVYMFLFTQAFDRKIDDED